MLDSHPYMCFHGQGCSGFSGNRSCWRQNSEGKSKKAQGVQSTAANPTAASGSGTGHLEPSAWKTIIDSMAKASGLCSSCLHTVDKAADISSRCLHAHFKPEAKWGAHFTTAVQAEMQRTGKTVWHLAFQQLIFIAHRYTPLWV